jgi:hypothetical protein
MSSISQDLNIKDFLVPIDSSTKGKVFVLWPCDGPKFREFILENFEIDIGERDSWEGICHFSKESDEKIGQPTAVIAIRNWNMELIDDPADRGMTHHLSVLAHECFHAAEWMTSQAGKPHPMIKNKENWEPWEDAAYLLQGIMRRALNYMIK